MAWAAPSRHVVFQTDSGCGTHRRQQEPRSPTCSTTCQASTALRSVVDPFTTDADRAAAGSSNSPTAQPSWMPARAQLEGAAEAVHGIGAASRSRRSPKLDAQQDAARLSAPPARQRERDPHGLGRRLRPPSARSSSTTRSSTSHPRPRPTSRFELDQDADIDGVDDRVLERDSRTRSSGILGVGEVTGVLIAAIVLVVMLGALLPAALPLVSSLVGVGVGVAGSLAFSGVVDMASVTPVLGVMLGLAVGIDYSLFIINRHRRQLKVGRESARLDPARQRHRRQRRRVRGFDRADRAARAQRHRHPVPRRHGNRRSRLRSRRRARRGHSHPGAARTRSACGC